MDIFIKAAEYMEMPVRRNDDEPLQKLFVAVRSELNLDLKNIKTEQAKFWKQHPSLVKVVFPCRYFTMLDLVPTDHHGYNTGSYSLPLHHKYFSVTCHDIVVVDPVINNPLVTRQIKGSLSSFDHVLLLTSFSDFTFDSFFFLFTFTISFC